MVADNTSPDDEGQLVLIIIVYNYFSQSLYY